jgi:hypothetical protein
MAANSTSFLERKVDQLFAPLNAKPGDCCRNPVTGVGFVPGLDPAAPQKDEAVRALYARAGFAATGPRGAPSLPLSYEEMEDYRNAGGLKALVGFYARSLSRGGYGRRSYDVGNHPSFHDFACGLMAMAEASGLWELEGVAALKRRFRPRPLPGMTPGAYWAPPKEYKETMDSYRRAGLTP